MAEQQKQTGQVTLASLLSLERVERSTRTGEDDHRIMSVERALKHNEKYKDDPKKQITIKPVILAGATMTTDYVVLANSDGDVVFHSLINAVFSAAGKRDIGFHFPDKANGPWTGVNSEQLVKLTMGEIRADGWSVESVGVSITSNKIIRINPKFDEMRENINRVFEVMKPDLTAIHATSGEGLSLVSRGHGIHVLGTATLVRIRPRSE